MHSFDTTLRTLDLQLFQLASFYDISNSEERARSVRDLERFFFRVGGLLQPDLFIEAGARNARSSIRARRHMKEARIVAFEANPLNYNRHKGTPEFASSNVEYIHSALSDSDGEITFNIQIVKGKESADGQGSILTRNEAAEGEKPVSVSAVRLDNFFRPASFNSAVVWMDVEGATRQVLTGTEGIVKRVDMLYVEVEDRRYWDDQWLSSDVLKYALANGLTPVARDFQSRYQYNILFLSERSLQHEQVRFALAEHISRVGTKASLEEDKPFEQKRVS